MGFIDELLAGLDRTLVTTVCTVILILLLCAIGFLIKHRKEIAEISNQWFIQKQEKEEIFRLVHENKERLDEYAENRIHDREQSFEIQRQLTQAIADLSIKLDAMEKYQAEEKERQNKRIRAEMKDKISRLYRYYHEKQEWNNMEKEAFNDLIEEYEDAGGKNSFVHTVAQAESYLWRVVNNK